MTTIRLQTERVGAAAAQMLLERITGTAENVPARSMELPTELILRSSTVKGGEWG